MELKLNIYTTRLCREIERTASARDFELSTGICEDVLNMIHIDMFEGGLESLSDDSMKDLMIGIVKDAFPYFLELVKEIFELTDEEAKRIKISEIVSVVLGIVKYSFSQLASTLKVNKGKN